MVVGTSPEDAEELRVLPDFEGRICVVARNSPTSVTLSGDADAIEEAKVIFDDKRKFARALRVDKRINHITCCLTPGYTLTRFGKHRLRYGSHEMTVSGARPCTMGSLWRAIVVRRNQTRSIDVVT